jgi:hypothetical protein
MLEDVLTTSDWLVPEALQKFCPVRNHYRSLLWVIDKALIEQLISDRILVLVQSGKFYELDPDVMGRVPCVNYHDLAQSRFSPELDSYLYDVLAKNKD